MIPVSIIKGINTSRSIQIYTFVYLQNKHVSYLLGHQVVLQSWLDFQTNSTAVLKLEPEIRTILVYLRLRWHEFFSPCPLAMSHFKALPMLQSLAQILLLHGGSQFILCKRGCSLPPHTLSCPQHLAQVSEHLCYLNQIFPITFLGR